MPRVVVDDYRVMQSDAQFTHFLAGLSHASFKHDEADVYRLHRGLPPLYKRPAAPPAAERSKPAPIPVKAVKTPLTGAQQRHQNLLIRHMAIAVRADIAQQKRQENN